MRVGVAVLMAVSSVASEAVSRSKSSWVYTVKEPSSSGPPTCLGLGLGEGRVRVRVSVMVGV